MRGFEAQLRSSSHSINMSTVAVRYLLEHEEAARQRWNQRAYVGRTGGGDASREMAGFEFERRGWTRYAPLVLGVAALSVLALAAWVELKRHRRSAR